MKAEIKKRANSLGFAAVGITTAELLEGYVHLQDAFATGRVGTMQWLGRNPSARCDPRSLLPNARSVICCALPYGEDGVVTDTKTEGRRQGIARFARGADYHLVVREKLERLCEVIRTHVPDARTKCCVDTSPILEKALAVRAGLGVLGKHALLMNSAWGSYVVLGEILTDVELEPDEPRIEDLCGGCTACLDACPTKALIAPFILDARQCLSYLTLEHKGPIAEELQTFIVSGMQGCDRCQEACPYNHQKEQNG